MRPRRQSEANQFRSGHLTTILADGLVGTGAPDARLGSGSDKHHWDGWRARRDSNPRPSDPKLSSRQSEQRPSIRAWNGHREDAVFVDSGVSLDPAPERVLIPSREPERVRCPRRNRLASNAHDDTQDYTTRL